MQLTFPVALAGLALLTAGGIAGAILLGQPWLILVVVVIVAVLAGLFLVQYSRRPGPETETLEPDEDLEPFVDPVEEADRAEAEASPEPDEGPGAIADGADLDPDRPISN